MQICKAFYSLEYCSRFSYVIGSKVFHHYGHFKTPSNYALVHFAPLLLKLLLRACMLVHRVSDVADYTLVFLTCIVEGAHALANRARSTQAAFLDHIESAAYGLKTVVRDRANVFLQLVPLLLLTPPRIMTELERLVDVTLYRQRPLQHGARTFFRNLHS